MRTHALPAQVLVTGATGLVGSGTIERLLSIDRDVHVFALLHRPTAWPALAARLGLGAPRVTAVCGDVTRDGLGLDAAARAALAGVRAVVHCAADTSFSTPLEAALAVNANGTRNVLALAEVWQTLLEGGNSHKQDRQCSRSLFATPSPNR
jgi:nucleoside-diphosphate-sugar epimerase